MMGTSKHILLAWILFRAAIVALPELVNIGHEFAKRPFKICDVEFDPLFTSHCLWTVFLLQLRSISSSSLETGKTHKALRGLC